MADVTTMADSEVQDIENFDISPRGTLSRRSGIVNHKRSGIWADVKGFTWGQLNL